ncbi:cell envelope biogenesis protein OmpA [Trinickia symbiotica]|uniref:Cell envelope biogenesis protein OmpA n=2 Tax=Trinickia symbiotica TaxID=863227 RepID=A0A2T3XLA3_9BURK|nr:cell envelope biogenesis protein OmpA [Trinickia symbiotica]
MKLRRAANAPRKKLIALGVSTSVLAGCAINPQSGQPEFAPAVKTTFQSIFDSPDPCSSNDRNIGVLVGAGIGAIAGHYLGKNTGQTLAGAAAGALVGGLIGHAMDQRRCNLYRVAQQYNMKLASAPVTASGLGISPQAGSSANDTVGLDVQMGSQDDEFLPGTATLTPRSREYLAHIADQYSPAALGPQATPAQKAQFAQRHLLIVGHTDERDDASGAELAALSEARARAVAQVFAARGVPAANIEYQGAGDALPIVPNGTQNGHSDNNRVEVVDMPNLDYLARYAANRAANPANFTVAQQAADRPHVSAGALDEQIGEASHTAPAAALDSTHAATTTHPARKKAKSKLPPSTVDARSSSAPVAAASSTAPAISTFGFDGKPMNDAGYRVDLGAARENSSFFNFIRPANADTPVTIGSCLLDHPHVSTSIRNLATNQTLKVDDALPGLYGQPWFGDQGAAGIALMHVYVPRDGAAPIPPVTAEIFRRDDQGYSHEPIARFADAPVNVYRGSSATLYRVFLHGGAQCIDLRVPVKSAKADGIIVYPSDGKEYQAAGAFTSKG